MDPEDYCKECSEDDKFWCADVGADEKCVDDLALCCEGDKPELCKDEDGNQTCCTKEESCEEDGRVYCEGENFDGHCVKDV